MQIAGKVEGTVSVCVCVCAHVSVYVCVRAPLCCNGHWRIQIRAQSLPWGLWAQQTAGEEGRDTQMPQRPLVGSRMSSNWLVTL